MLIQCYNTDSDSLIKELWRQNILLGIGEVCCVLFFCFFREDVGSVEEEEEEDDAEGGSEIEWNKMKFRKK